MPKIINNIQINNSGKQNHDKNNASKKWWESTWFQVVMLFAALATIFSFIFYISRPTISVKENTPTKNIEPTQNNNFTITGYKMNNLATSTEAFLTGLRKKDDLRQLSALESDLTIQELSSKAYFYVSSVYLGVTPRENSSVILDARVNRFRSYSNLYFEMHKISPTEIYLLGFISEESYIRINKNNNIIKNITIFPHQVDNTDYLIILPIQKITEANDRDIEFDDGSTVRAVDLKIQN
ncbi:MAG: hypothetical protein UX94_C0002G0040 [Parcubacteria group bacterium GW2011_GWA2_47_21]|nr:MAG: hypothetical protein UX94_C0002G0040 [Parcubacteria group bacterium GW2011_GWA2_47_21]